MAKRIVVPANIQIPKGQQKSGGQTENEFTEFLIMAINNYPKAGKTIEQIEQTVKVVRKIKEAKGKESLVLEDAEHKLVFAAIDSGDWPPSLAVFCWPFIEAVKNAKDPKEPDESDEPVTEKK